MPITTRLFLFSLFCGCLLFLQTPAYGWNQLYVNGACEQTGAPCRSTVGNAGSSGGCCDPQAADVAVCVSQRPCRGIFGYHWPKIPINWTFNSNGMAGKSAFSKLDEKTLTEALKQVWDTWAKPSCTSLRHNFLGVTSTKPNPTDNKVVIYLPSDTEWAQLGISQQVLAFSNPTPNSKGELTDGDILFNPKPGKSWNTHPNVERDDLDFSDTALHEIGHTLGLAHSHQSSAVMYYALRGTGPVYKGLSSDEEAAMCVLYPAQNTCQSDSNCGQCRTCQTQVCQESNPLATKTCKPCQTDQDCDANRVCTPGPAGSRCLQRCNQDCCPAGYRCISAGNNRLCSPILGSCPAIPCTKQADCGAQGTCSAQRGICVATNPPYSADQCYRSCSKDQDCNASHLCIERIPGQSFCAPSCSSGKLCPEGFHCRPHPRGDVCLPYNPFFCPCSNNAECPLGQVCKNNLCQIQDGGVLFAPCSDEAPCSQGLSCLRSSLESHRCVQPCNPGTCPAGTTCELYLGSYSICMGVTDRDIGKSCDGLQFRCQKELVCVQLDRNTVSGYCMEECSLSQGCKSGGTCNLQSTIFRYCECGPNDTCGVGRTCQVVGQSPNQIKLCVCTQSPCSNLCNNQVCDSDRGENCANCPDDCPCGSGKQCVAGVCQDSSNTCGNGVCDPGENCSSCAKDCACPPGQRCANNVCVISSNRCGDGTCSSDENCLSCPSDCSCAAGMICNGGMCVPASSCGNGVCDQPTETCSTCPGDCSCPAGTTCGNGQCIPVRQCGNSRCDSDENCNNCPEDCPCPQGQSCQSGVCKFTDQRDQCGNGICDINVGENCSTCAADCACPSKFLCHLGICQRANTRCPLDEQTEKCDPNTGQCEVVCSQTGCGCQQSSSPFPFTLFLLGFLLLFRRVNKPSHLVVSGE